MSQLPGRRAGAGARPARPGGRTRSAGRTGRTGHRSSPGPRAGESSAARSNSGAIRRGVRMSAGRAVAAVTARRGPRLARQVAVLGAVFIAVALVLAFPFQSYLQAQQELRAQQGTETQMRAQLASLSDRKAALENPDYIKAEARRRLQLVQPGDTVYVVHLDKPPVVAAPDTPAPVAVDPWYAKLWDTLSDPAAGSVPPK